MREAFAELREVPDFIHERMISLFHRYLLVGGMPDAVNAFLENRTIDQVRVAQKDIIGLYKRDILKYAPKDERLVIQNIFNLVPSEMTGTSKRFRFSSIKDVKRLDAVSDEFLWLIQSNVALAAYQVSDLKPPLLITKKDNRFKLFYSDVGLLTKTFLKTDTLGLLDGDAKTKNSAMNLGGVYENAVA